MAIPTIEAILRLSEAEDGNEYKVGTLRWCLQVAWAAIPESAQQKAFDDMKDIMGDRLGMDDEEMEGIVGSLEIPEAPFLITAFTDATEAVQEGSHTTEIWDDVSTLAYEFLGQEFYVVVTDKNGQAIRSDRWM